MTATQLSTTGSQALAENGAAYVPVAGYEGLSPDDFSLPTLKLVQAQTTIDGAEKHLGEYVKTDTGEFVHDPRLLIVGIQKSRIFFPPEYGGADSDPLCRSDDAVAPRAEFIGEEVQGEYIPAACADCPFSRWGEDKGAPPCTLSENWAAILDGGDVVILRLKGSSARASGMLKNIMRANRVKRQPTYIQLGSTYKRSEKGQFYVAAIAALKEAPPADSLDLARQLAGINLAARAADEAPEPVRRVEPDSDDYQPSDADTPF